MAKELLNKQDEFFPFAAVQDENENIEMITPFYKNDRPKSIELIEQFREFAKNELPNENFNKLGFCYDVNVRNKGKIQTAIIIEFISFDKKIITTNLTIFYNKKDDKYEFYE